MLDDTQREEVYLPILIEETHSIEEVFAKFLRRDVANGDASEDTLRGYRAQVQQWVLWCQEMSISPMKATVDDVIDYRQALLHTKKYKPATIAHKLTILRQFYAALIAHGLRIDNPVAGLRAPRAKRSQEDFKYLSEVDYTILLRSVGKENGVHALRDRVLLTLMGLQGLRTIECERANVEDLRLNGEVYSLLVRGKNHDRVLYLRQDVATTLHRYLALRENAITDQDGTPLFTARGNRAANRRLTRRGIRFIVDGYLKKADLKKPGISDHALRHTAATLAYKYTQDLRGVQEMLGHADPKTTARYAHVIDRMRNNPANAIPIEW